MIGPQLLGHATNLILAGVFGKKLPAGVTQAQYAAELRAHGHGDRADLLTGDAGRPPRPRHRLRRGRRVLLLGAGHATCWRGLFGWLQAWLLSGVGAAHRLPAAHRRRGQAHRLPLSYFDAQPRGELLSRVTNDIDNLAQSLQQTISQLLTSLLTVVGVLTMMFAISPAAGADRAGHASRPR